MSRSAAILRRHAKQPLRTAAERDLLSNVHVLVFPGDGSTVLSTLKSQALPHQTRSSLEISTSLCQKAAHCIVHLT